MNPIIQEEDWQRFVVKPEVTIAEALPILEKNPVDILLLCQKDRQLMGTLSSKDIRQGVLSGVSFNEPCAEVADQNPITANPKISYSEAEAIMDNGRDPSANYLPLVDTEGRVVNLLSRYNQFQHKVDALSAVIMAGGFGKRLGDLTKELPKPLLPVAGRPIIERTLLQLRDIGIRQFYITTHYLTEKIKAHFGDGSSFGVAIEYIEEDQPLGTAGALGLIKNPSKPFLVINGDIITKLDFHELWAFHREQKATLTIAVRPYDYEIPYGVIETDKTYLRAIREKPNFTCLVNAGIYIVNPSALSSLPKQEPLDMTDLMETLLDHRLPVATFPMIEYWLDIGLEADYLKAKQDFKENHS